jgi:hypothetical protein
VPQLALAVRIRGGAIARVAALAPGVALTDVAPLCTAAALPLDPKLDKLAGALGGAVARVEYGRASEAAGIDVYVEPGVQDAAVPASAQAN